MAKQENRAKVKAFCEKYKNHHPRILLDDEMLSKIRSLGDDVIYRSFLKTVEDTVTNRKPREYFVDENDIFDIWQRDEGDKLADISFAYAVTKEKKYLDAAVSWAEKICSYPTWGRHHEGPDLPAGHQLFGLGLFYDWCYHDISEKTRKTVIDKYKEQYTLMYTAASESGFWREWDLQNHMWINVGGMAVAAMSAYDELEGMEEGILLALNRYADVMEALGSDGVGHEGAMYWDYGTTWLLKFMLIAEKNIDVDMFETPFFKNTHLYRINIGLPLDFCEGSERVVDLCDGSRSGGGSPCTVLDILAQQYRDGYAAWYSKFLMDKGMNVGGGWISVLGRYDIPELKDVRELPLLHDFYDLGIVTARSNWDNGSMLTFKCGPFIGHEAVDKFAKPPYLDPGGGHVHQDTNHFVFHANGEFVIRDDGYAWKTTTNHNTLLIDGSGQQGGEEEWFRGAKLLERCAKPTMLAVKSGEEFDYMVGDGTEAYDPAIGLTKFKRHLVYAKPNTVFVIDEVEMNREAELELRFFPESDEYALTDDGVVFVGKKTKTLISELVSDGGEMKCEDVLLYLNIYKTSRDKKAVRFIKNANKWLHVSVIQCAALNEPMKPVGASVENGKVMLFADGYDVFVDIEKNTADMLKKSTADKANEPCGDISKVYVNGKPAKFTGNGFEFNTEEFVKIVRKEFANVDICVVPKRASADFKIKAPSSGKYGEYLISVDGIKEYKLTVHGTEFNGKKAEVTGVTASLVSSAHPPESILNPNRSEYWTANGDEVWILMELSEVSEIAGVDISWYIGDLRVQYFEIELSEDGRNFTGCGRMESSGITTYPEFYEITGKAKYVKIVCRGNTQGRYNSVVDAVVYTKL